MNLDKFTQKSQDAIFSAQQIAQDMHHQAIEPAHLLLALIRQQDEIIPALVTKVAGSVQAFQEDLQNDLKGRLRIQGANMDVGLSPASAEVLTSAERYAKGLTFAV